MANILQLPADVMALMALELDTPSILNYCLSNKRFNEVICNSQTFWRNKFTKDYPGVRAIPKSVRNVKAFYETFYNTIKQEPGILPRNILLANVNPNLSLLHQGAKQNLNYNMLCNVNAETYRLCRDDNTWKQMLNTFYSHIKGNPEAYKDKYYPNLSWKNFYSQIVHSPALLQTGFV